MSFGRRANRPATPATLIPATPATRTPLDTSAILARAEARRVARDWQGERSPLLPLAELSADNCPAPAFPAGGFTLALAGATTGLLALLVYNALAAPLAAAVVAFRVAL